MSANAEEIVELERAYWSAIQSQDVKMALELTAEPCVVTGAQGFSAIDKKTYAEMAKSPFWSLEKFEFIGEPLVQFAGEDVAVIAYRIRQEMTVEGKPLVVEAADSSTWVRREGKWICVVHTESILGDPFGRDRVMKAPTNGKLQEQSAVANLAVKDLGAAKKFYENTIGLTPIMQQGEELVVYKSGDSTVNVYRSEFAGTNRATAVTWSVSDIDSTVKSLKSKGVTFEHYQMPDMHLEGDVHVSNAEGMKVAWFKDPDGNILNIISQ